MRILSSLYVGRDPVVNVLYIRPQWGFSFYMPFKPAKVNMRTTNTSQQIMIEKMLVQGGLAFPS